MAYRRRGRTRKNYSRNGRSSRKVKYYKVARGGTRM